MRLLAPLRAAAFRRLWAAAGASLTGDGIFLLTLTWHVYESSGGVAGMALTGVALAAPQLVLFPIGGVLADRADRRLVMMATDLVRCGCLLVVAALVWGDPPSMMALYGVVAVYGAATGLFGPSFDALVPRLVPERHLTQANALDQVMRPVALRILGPATGGLLVGFAGSGITFAVNAGLFAASAALLAGLPRIVRTRRTTSVMDDLREGGRYVRSQPWLWATLAAGALGLLIFFGPSEVLVPYLVQTIFGDSATDLGLVFASGGLGAVAAAAVIGHVGLPTRLLSFTYVAWALATLAVAGYGLATSTAHLAVVCAVVNAGEAAGLVAWATAKQRLVPRFLLGRVSSVDWFISTALVPLSYAITAPAAELLGVRATLIWAGIAGAFMTLAFLLVPGVRGVDTSPMGVTREPREAFVRRPPRAPAQ